ncbi:MAG: hydroxymethylglutaryl-CoA reductase, degradative [Gammaproteobacteria bacterium]|nr:hydroxymethylglutaryl-CoA reductase, degradative [Gammaproteobacteria bacterium]
MDKSRIPGFYKLSLTERIQAVQQRALLGKDEMRQLTSGSHTLSPEAADKMIENVIGVLGIPMGVGLNFVVNEKPYLVPMAVEEPSIVAAISSAAKLALSTGGFHVQSTEQLLIGQIQIVDVPHPAKARTQLQQRRSEIINLANSLHPNMVARGGGAKDIEVHLHQSPSTGKNMLVVHLLVDTCDAMGANLVNTMCEGVASLVESITGGKVFLRILSNLTDRALVIARVTYPVAVLAGKGFSGEQVRDGIILANDLALVDPYRATTHNKGIMNGIDAVALATGNDWRAIEAAAHAYAARNGRYSSLTKWYRDEHGNLAGELEIPMKVGTVGGPLQSNRSVMINHRMLAVESARELAELMGAVGLAQNFSALRALVTSGIQSGHMTLHARSVAMAAGAPDNMFDTVVDRLIESGEIKIWKAREIVDTLQQQPVADVPAALDAGVEALATGHGKVILLGEHAVVYGSHALAVPVPLAIQAKIADNDEGIDIIIPRWGAEQRLHRKPEQRHSFEKPIALILEQLELLDEAMKIEIFPNVPRAVGLGSSAAVAVAITRALDQHFRLGLNDEQINALAFECEKVAHGTPSGIDNTMATYGYPMLYRKGEPALMEALHIGTELPLVIGFSGVESLTAKMVARVAAAHAKHPAIYRRMFHGIDGLVLEAKNALQSGDWQQLGELMNVNQGLLNAMQISCWEIEEMIQIARQHGALGAKVTGGGGGGACIALCPQRQQEVIEALSAAGYQAMAVSVPITQAQGEPK